MATAVEPLYVYNEEGGHKKISVPPPDTLEGWIVVLGSFVVLMLVIGTTNSFGVYLQEYKLEVFPTVSSSTISWIGSLQFSIMCLFGIGVGILTERIDTRIVVAIGCIITGTSLLVASACNTITGLILTQGLLYGIGGSCIMTPAVSMPSQWMKKYRAIATGFAVSGGSIGGLWMSFSTRAMVSNIGWKWSLRINGLIIIVVGCVASLLLRSRLKVSHSERLIDFSSLKNVRFVLLFFASLFSCGGYFMPYYFMPSYAVVALGRSTNWGANISSILNAGSIAGRLLVGFSADFIGPLNALIISTIMSTIAVLMMWLPCKSLGVMIGSAMVFGFFSGSLVSLVPVVTANLFGIKRLPSILGLLLISYMIGTLVSSPVGGALLEKYGNGVNFTWLIVYNGIFFCLAIVTQLILRILLARKLCYKI
ncbi:MFS general substrate transporter [Coemansia reversa NRRL 1564]|uniref:MFS general substrate transporter n=1 Tax=Coemansia reversa (strain ATCC 12441 / NRRL 1564) TaxID=763665 RepID=A0A2G5B201_COERN|nr:MFS general substrate transporter [Coemansia reversa NRRL 1564]|eukprot:PIA13039.1 MFS general substrate transporter [Coemansia reversa NRRL 1564]